MDNLTASLAKEFPDTDSGWTVRVRELSDQVIGNHRQTLLLLCGAVFFVLLMASANVANLILARSASRLDDLAIRTYLGASRVDHFRHVMAQSLLLGTAAGFAGLFLAVLGSRLFLALKPIDLPLFGGFEPSSATLVATLVTTLLAALACGLPAAIQSGRTLPRLALSRAAGRTATGSWERVRRVLVVGQVGLSLLLSLGCGLLVESLVRLNRFDLGFNPKNVISIRVDLGHDSSWRKDFLRRLLARIERRPSVAAVGAINQAPLEGLSDSFRLWFPGESYTRFVDIPTAEIRAASPGYFGAVGLRLERGRLFGDSNSAGSEAVINQTMARTYWPGKDPIGQSLSIEGPEGELHVVVGIIRDSHYAGPGQGVKPELYLPYQSLAWPSVAVLARSEREGTSLTETIRDELQSLDPTLPPYNIATLDDRLAGLLAPRRFSAILLSLFAATALLLMTLGLFGVMASFVADRTREIGIRLALGAQRSTIVAMVLRQGLTLTLFGLALGGLASFAARGLVTDLLFETSLASLLTPGVVVPLILAVSLAACLIPVARTFRIQPAEALRHE